MTKNTTPFAYFITFRTYGTWLHGDERSSTSPLVNEFQKPFITAWKPLENAMRREMKETEFCLEFNHSQTVLHSIINTCQYNNWKCYAAHIRPTHAHIVLTSSLTKEKTMGKLKCYATKDLKKHHGELMNREHFWSRHGSTKNIWNEGGLFPALYYVVKQQGNPCALFFDPEYYDAESEATYETLH